MAVGLLLEFDGVGVDQYDAVNERLGIDMSTGQGDWPEGMLFHAGGAKPGGWAVMEVWASQADQQRFMEGRLGRALQEEGITEPPKRVEWIELAAHHYLGA
jgi:hypothetical protein